MKTDVEAARKAVKDAFAAEKIVLGPTGLKKFTEAIERTLVGYLNKHGPEHPTIDLWSDPRALQVHHFVLNEVIPLVADVVRAAMGEVLPRPRPGPNGHGNTRPAEDAHIETATNAVFLSVLVRQRCGSVLNEFEQAVAAAEHASADRGDMNLMTPICEAYWSKRTADATS